MVKGLREALHLPVKLPFQRNGAAEGRAYFAILDVGTEVAKALVLMVVDGRGEVLGVGRRPQGQLDIQDGLVTDVEAVHMDGHAVSKPLSFQGRHLTVTVFNAFAPLVHIGAMRTVVESLDLELLSAVAEPYAVASALSSRPVLDYGGVVIDIGGG